MVVIYFLSIINGRRRHGKEVLLSGTFVHTALTAPECYVLPAGQLSPETAVYLQTVIRPLNGSDVNAFRCFGVGK